MCIFFSVLNSILILLFVVCKIGWVTSHLFSIGQKNILFPWILVYILWAKIILFIHFGWYHLSRPVRESKEQLVRIDQRSLFRIKIERKRNRRTKREHTTNERNTPSTPSNSWLLVCNQLILRHERQDNLCWWDNRVPFDWQRDNVHCWPDVHDEFVDYTWKEKHCCHNDIFDYHQELVESRYHLRMNHLRIKWK